MVQDKIIKRFLSLLFAIVFVVSDVVLSERYPVEYNGRRHQVPEHRTVAVSPDNPDIPMVECVKAGLICSKWGYCSHAPNNSTLDCFCPDYCAELAVSATICGTDRRTYNAICEMKNYACAHKINTEFAYDGACKLDPKDGSLIYPLHQEDINNLPVIPMEKCAELNLHCSIYSRCVTHPIDKTPACRCPPRCDPEEPDKYVCGLDAKTYRNMCDLEVTSCLFNANITASYFGRCQINEVYKG